MELWVSRVPRWPCHTFQPYLCPIPVQPAQRVISSGRTGCGCRHNGAGCPSCQPGCSCCTSKGSGRQEPDVLMEVGAPELQRSPTRDTQTRRGSSHDQMAAPGTAPRTAPGHLRAAATATVKPLRCHHHSHRYGHHNALQPIAALSPPQPLLHPRTQRLQVAAGGARQPQGPEHSGRTGAGAATGHVPGRPHLGIMGCRLSKSKQLGVRGGTEPEDGGDRERALLHPSLLPRFPFLEHTPEVQAWCKEKAAQRDLAAIKRSEVETGRARGAAVGTGCAPHGSGAVWQVGRHGAPGSMHGTRAHGRVQRCHPDTGICC